MDNGQSSSVEIQSGVMGRLVPDSFTGADLRAVRKSLGLSMTDAAKLIGASKNSVARWERGELNFRHPQVMRFLFESLEEVREEMGASPTEMRRIILDAIGSVEELRPTTETGDRLQLRSDSGRLPESGV